MLTKGERHVLEKLATDLEVLELVEAIPGGWWIEEDRIDGRICWSLLRKVLISEHQYSDENFKRYYINEWGRNALLSNKVSHQTSGRLASVRTNTCACRW
jgi:hypothetical protein